MLARKSQHFKCVLPDGSGVLVGSWRAPDWSRARARASPPSFLCGQWPKTGMSLRCSARKGYSARVVGERQSTGMRRILFFWPEFKDIPLRFYSCMIGLPVFANRIPIFGYVPAK